MLVNALMIFMQTFLCSLLLVVFNFYCMCYLNFCENFKFSEDFDLGSGKITRWI